MKSRKFNVPDYGIVEENNAVFMFLKRLLVGIQEIKLSDLEIGQKAIAFFQSGAGNSFCEIERVE